MKCIFSTLFGGSHELDFGSDNFLSADDIPYILLDPPGYALTRTPTSGWSYPLTITEYMVQTGSLKAFEIAGRTGITYLPSKLEIIFSKLQLRVLILIPRIIFVHGLYNDTIKAGAKHEICWLRDLP